MELVHVLSRGVDKRKIFMDRQDHLRFIHDMFEFNDQAPVLNAPYRFHASKGEVNGVVKHEPRKLLVNIHAFCLMPNHYHFLLSDKVPNGISQFMKKLNIGYAKYFNQKYERRGTLFESRYKSVPIKSEAHFIHIPYYIHLNPLDLVAPEWRERKLNDLKTAIKFLNTYRWSSHLDYIGQKNFPSVTQRDFLASYFETPAQYKRSIEKWLGDLSVSSFDSSTFE